MKKTKAFKGQGRPLGLIALWMQVSSVTDKSEHNSVKMNKMLGGASYRSQRREARLQVMANTDYAGVVAAGRDQGSSDSDIEPLVVP